MMKTIQVKITPQQCKQMLSQDIGEAVSQHFGDKRNQLLIETSLEAQKEDGEKKQGIKEKLIHDFFTRHKRNNLKMNFKKKFNMSSSVGNDQKKSLQKKIRDSLSVVLRSSIPAPRTRSSQRYGSGSNTPMDLSFRPLTSPLTQRIDHKSLKNQNLSDKIDNLIDETHKIEKYRTVFHQRMSPSRKRDPQVKDKRQRYRIMNKIIQNDVDEFLNFSSQEVGQYNPELGRQKYQERKRQELTNFDKYNMSYMRFIKQKTHSNIQKQIYNDKIRQKNTYVQKFQKYILEEYKLSDEGRSRLSKIFEGIGDEYKGHLKKRNMKGR